MEVFAGLPSTWTHRSAGLSMRSTGSDTARNTLVLYIWGDNGASAEGQNGTISELLAQNGIPTTTKQQIAALSALGGLDVLGSPKTDNMYHAGWAWAGSTPYQATKLSLAFRRHAQSVGHSLACAKQARFHASRPVLACKRRGSDHL
jgi:hypothetical protein